MQKANIVRPPEQLSESDALYVMSLREKDITLKLLEEFFAHKLKTPARFNPNDIFTLPKGKFFNEKAEKTTVGRFIFNCFFLSEKFLPLVGYKNVAVDGGTLDDIESELSDYLIEDKIKTSDFVDALDKLQWLGFIIAKFINSSLSGDFLILPPETAKLKAELLVKYAKEIAEGDILTVAKIEAELIADSKKRVKDNPSYQIYESGGRGSFANNFKNTSIMRGSIKNLADPTKIHVSTSSLIDGIPPSELEHYGDLITQASYSRAVGTQEGGYEAKKLSAAFQNVVLGDAGSDCGTNKYYNQEINANNIGLFMYRYIQVGTKLVLISSDNKDQFVGKVVKLRTPLYCIGQRYCSKCAGELYYRLGIYNVGILTNRVGTSLLNASLKAFHDMSLKVKTINIDDYID